MPPSAHVLSGQIGLSGSSVWMLSGADLSISRDGGKTWSPQPVPADASSSSIAAVGIAPGRPIWLAVPEASSVVLYTLHSDASSWSSQRLVPTWPSAVPAGEPASNVTIAAGPGKLLTIGVTVQTPAPATFSTLFTSNDDGDSFVEHPTKSGSIADDIWDHLAFISQQAGILVAGQSSDQLIYTSDGGTTWASSSVASLPVAGSYYLGAPVVEGADIVIPLTGLVSAEGPKQAHFSLLVSHDGGATLSAGAGPALSLDTYAAPATDSLGRTTWVVPYSGGKVFETEDTGRTWTTISTADLPGGIAWLALTGPSSATALVSLGGCPGFVQGCWSKAYLVATSDGGHTWMAI